MGVEPGRQDLGALREGLKPQWCQRRSVPSAAAPLAGSPAPGLSFPFCSIRVRLAAPASLSPRLDCAHPGAKRRAHSGLPERKSRRRKRGPSPGFQAPVSLQEQAGRSWGLGTGAGPWPSPPRGTPGLWGAPFETPCKGRLNWGVGAPTLHSTLPASHLPNPRCPSSMALFPWQEHLCPPAAVGTAVPGPGPVGAGTAAASGGGSPPISWG